MSNYKKRSLINTVSSLVMQVVIMVIGLILPRLYLKAYGSDVNGLVTSINQFVSYLTLVEAGLASAGINALFEPIAKKDNARISRVLSAIKKFYFQVGYIFSGLIVGLAFLYPLFVTLDGFSYSDIVILVIVLGLHGTIDFFTLSKYRALLTADQKYYVIANATSIAYVINFIVVFIAIKLGFSITIVRTIALTLYIVRTLIINLYVRKKYKNIDNKAKPDNVSLSKRWDAMILQFLGLAQTSLPVIVLTFFATELSSVSVYSIYNLVASSILTLLTALTNGVSATFGDIIALKDEKRLQKWYCSYELLFLSLCSVVYSVMTIMYIPFVQIYTSGITDCEYIFPFIAILFAANGLLYNLKTPAGILIGAAGVFKETKKGTIIQTIIATVGCIVLTPLFGIPGLLMGLILSNIYRDFDLIIFMSKKVTHLSATNSLKNVLSCLVPYFISVLITVFFPLNNLGIFEWLIFAVFSTVLCGFLTLIFAFAFSRKTAIELLQSLNKRMRRRKA